MKEVFMQEIIDDYKESKWNDEQQQKLERDEH